ncbi:hypothetical protein AB0953_32645 [Streptomyces sp. NPDC046866]|uniref:hypothetical protein n=1 Tax=Streptomyces sp. NPDC046866 TaxID=3154921 RepID=UPI003455A014
MSGTPWPTGHRFADRTRARHATVHALLEAGHSLRSVQRQLGMAWHTVKRFCDAEKPEDLFTGQWQNRTSVLDEYKPYLDDRWSEGCTNARKLWGDAGCDGSSCQAWVNACSNGNSSLKWGSAASSSHLRRPPPRARTPPR